MSKRGISSASLRAAIVALTAGRLAPLLALALALASGVTVGCGFWEEGSPAVTNAARLVRDRPDDGDPGWLVPAGVRTVIDIRVASLRESAWLAPALQALDPRARAAKREALGYDDLDDVDRIIYAVTAAGADVPTLVIAQGRLQATGIQDAFRARWPAAVVDGWRGISILSSGENALAFLTERTFVSGAPASVRAVIDRAFGVGPDVSADPALGPTRRALCPEGRDARPAILATVAVDDRLRARVGADASVPRELRQVGVRLDVGLSLELTALGILDDPAAAEGLARRLRALITDPATRLGLQAMGLSMILAGTRINQDGARVVVRASAGEDLRAPLSALLRTLLESSRGEPLRGSRGTGGFGSW